jgi:cardiolipin synthase
MIVLLHLLVQAALIVRALLRPDREPASRIAWVVVILAVPVIGIVAYLLLGERRLGRRREARRASARARLPDPARIAGYPAAVAAADTPERRQPLFVVGQSISGFAAVGGNHAELLADSDAAIAAMVADIDAARDHVHLIFYIWLPDGNGRRMGEALIRAAGRGVICRAMVDDLGSRALVTSGLWAAMGAAGVRLSRALVVGNPLLRVLTMTGRIDLRNHRKILVIDNRVTYCGSQNCADPAFLPKAKYGPWVDAVMRITGPVVRQNQLLFALDWMSENDDDLEALLLAPLPPAEAGPGPGFTAQVIATGPMIRPSAAPEMFTSLFYSARAELIVTTPYYVPVDSIQSGLRAAANRGVATTLVLPARNDDFAVGAAARSYYRDLLAAGVAIHEFRPGLLHAKSVTVDGEVTLIGSANMDCRSFALNFENNILLHDPGVTAAMRRRQHDYIAESRRVTAAEVAGWNLPRQLWNNTLAVVGPVL